MIGWRFRETMTGEWTRSNGKTEQLPLSFTFRASGNGWLATDFTVDGAIRADGLATDRPLSGNLIVMPIIGRFIRYDLDFSGDDKRRYSLSGQKDIDFLHPLITATLLPFTLGDDRGEAVGHGSLTIAGENLKKFLFSFRPFYFR